MRAYLTVEEVAERYATSKKAIHDRTRADRIPYLKRVGMRRHLFDPRHLELWDAGAGLHRIDHPDGSRSVVPVGCQIPEKPGVRVGNNELY